MKKITSFFSTLILITSVIAQQAGRIKITLAGAQCNRETWDDALQLDGKGDEVFFLFKCLLTGENNNLKFNYDKRTAVYGDKTNANWNNRVSAGSAVDLFGNNMGGIKGGDKFNCNELIGEYDMDANDVLAIIPTVWEWDGGTDIVSGFANTLNSITGPITSKAVQVAKSISPSAGDFTKFIVDAGGMILPAFTNTFSTIFGKTGDRPVGMSPNGSFGPKTVLIKTAWLQTIVNSNFGFGQGVIAVNYNEEDLGNNRDHGNYTLLLKFEFTPKPGTATINATPVTTTKPPPMIKTTIIKSTPNNGNPAVATSPIAGDWTGTYGDGENDGPIFYSFRFNNGGVMATLDRNGNLLNTGTYSFANNQVSGHYDQYSFSGILDANKMFHGTWGSGNNTSGLGKWKMTKK